MQLLYLFTAYNEHCALLLRRVFNMYPMPSPSVYKYSLEAFPMGRSLSFYLWWLACSFLVPVEILAPCIILVRRMGKTEKVIAIPDGNSVTKSLRFGNLRSVMMRLCSAVGLVLGSVG